MTAEVLHMKIGLSGSSNLKGPEFTISVNSKIYVDSTLQKGKENIEYFEFDAEVDEGDCAIKIELKNKQKYDTVLDQDGNIIEDLLLNIDSIEIDEIDLQTLLWTQSKYTPIYPQDYKLRMQSQGIVLEETLDNCVNLGWNGTWELPFTSPFYIWLLENI